MNGRGLFAVMSTMMLSAEDTMPVRKRIFKAPPKIVKGNLPLTEEEKLTLETLGGKAKKKYVLELKAKYE